MSNTIKKNLAVAEAEKKAKEAARKAALKAEREATAEAAHNVQPRENDMSITLYVSSGDDDDYGDEVEADYVIIRPKKGETK